ncbi:tail protein X [Neisseria sp. S1]|uniref:tail protein X n=1 Tax=Neisseria sp. S1 TaxID=3318354 RepID=UPI003A8449A6
MAANTVISRQGDTISAIAYRFYGRSAGMVEQILAANPGLCRLPAVLPVGTVITMPAVPELAAEKIATVNLWD